MVLGFCRQVTSRVCAYLQSFLGRSSQKNASSSHAAKSQVVRRHTLKKVRGKKQWSIDLTETDLRFAHKVDDLHKRRHVIASLVDKGPYPKKRKAISWQLTEDGRKRKKASSPHLKTRSKDSLLLLANEED